MKIKGKSVMSGTSQDELIVIDIASNSKFYSLSARNNEAITLINNETGKSKDVKILRTFEFTSDRKMMTVIVKIGPRTFAFCKGADTSLEPRLINMTS